MTNGEKLIFDTKAYPTMARIAPSGEFKSGVSILIDAVNQLKEQEEIADFSQELTEWLCITRAQGDEPTIVGGWISFVAGHFDNDVFDRWRRAVPQVEMGTAFMPEDRTIRIKYDPKNLDGLRDTLREAGRLLRGE